VIKKLHPSIPVIFGGLSSTFFYEELIGYPQVDFVVRGDSTEEPVLQLMRRIKSKGAFDDIPNVSWKDKDGAPHHNPLSWVLPDLNGIPLDYAYPVKSVIRYRSLSGMLPFNNWLDYPVTAVFTCGLHLNCHSCGGSRPFQEHVTIGYRSRRWWPRHPQHTALPGPEAIIGDIRRPATGTMTAPPGRESPRRNAGGADSFPRERLLQEGQPSHSTTTSNTESRRRSAAPLVGWRNVDVEETIRAAITTIAGGSTSFT
jgi:hypothetical protein